MPPFSYGRYLCYDDKNKYLTALSDHGRYGLRSGTHMFFCCYNVLGEKKKVLILTPARQYPPAAAGLRHKKSFLPES